MMTRQKALKHLKTGLAVVCLAIPAFTARAAEPSKQHLVYQVYAGGIHAVEADVTMDITPGGRYSLVLNAKTRGLLGNLAPWHGTFETHGWASKDGTRQPEQHKSTTTWRDEQEVKDYLYNRDGRFESITIDEHDKPTTIQEIDPLITEGTTDALSAALKVFEGYNQEGACEGESKVFDGKRSFLQTFTHKAETPLTSSKYNIYEGVAAECIVEVTPLKGKWHKKPRGWISIQEQGREHGTMPTVWLASLKEGLPAVPVKIRVKTDYGTLFMHLSEYKIGEDIITAENRVD